MYYVKLCLLQEILSCLRRKNHIIIWFYLLKFYYLKYEFEVDCSDSNEVS